LSKRCKRDLFRFEDTGARPKLLRLELAADLPALTNSVKVGVRLEEHARCSASWHITSIPGLIGMAAIEA
jgi:hypothetical protein